MNRTEKIKSYLLQLIYPQECVGCGITVPFDKTICPVCNYYIERIPKEKRCIKCGFERSRCQCKRTVYRFSGVIAPFYNIGVAKQAFYGYKFRRKYGSSQFFKEEMLKSVLCEYRNIDFDCIVCVPASGKRMRKFGFSPQFDLAKYLSKNLGLPFEKTALKRVNGKNMQHFLNRSERFSKIKGEYISNKELKNKTVLLVDDIMTTGATLDECARLLMLSGAEQVYCVTALITDREAPYDKRYTRVITNLAELTYPESKKK